MCAQTVAQFVFYKGNSAKCLLIFNWPNNLDNSNFIQLYVFWEVEVEDNKCEDFVPSLVKGLNWFSSCNVPSKLCNMVILKSLDYKSSMWVESNGWTSSSSPPILRGLQKATFNVLRWKKKNSTIVESTTQYCGYTTPKVIMISCSRNRISSFEISPWVAPSHSSLTFFTTMPKSTLVTSWKVVAPSMQKL